MPDTEHASGFLARWSERKLAARKGQRPPAEAEEGEDPVAEATPELEPAPPPAAGASAGAVLTDADMPPLESLDGNSDYSGFLSRGVSAVLRRQALARFFHSPHLNMTDGLDDFAEDYTALRPLGGPDHRGSAPPTGSRRPPAVRNRPAKRGRPPGLGHLVPLRGALPSEGTRLGCRVARRERALGPPSRKTTNRLTDPTPPSPEQTA